MRRGLLIAGLILLVIFGFVAWISYAAGQSDCAVNFFTGNETNPSACVADAGTFSLSILFIIVGLILVILGAILKSTEPKPETGPGIGTPPGAPSGKVCLRCGAYYPDPVPAFCSKCGAPVGGTGLQFGPPSPPSPP